MTLMPPDITPEEEGIILRLPVLKAEDFRVTNGANLGDAMAEIDELVFDDSYGLSPEAETRQLAYTHNPVENSFAIASTSSVGTAGAPLHLDCAATFMLADGDTIEILVLVEISRLDQGVEQVFLMPLAALAPKTDYRLIGAARDTARTLFAEAACVSFLRGTRITLSDGRQVAVEDLTLEDRILTRDCGVQTPRWIGTRTTRASGEFAPIKIAAGALNNARDLYVSPNHRLFVYQRDDKLGVGRAEVMVQAQHLINGDTITRSAGGFVEYFQLLFDAHQIIYAEGIAAESMLLDPRTHPALPGEIAESLNLPADLHGVDHLEEFEIPEGSVDAQTAAQLKKASSG